MNKSSLAGDVVVIGAGIIGLSIAFELASRGAIVRVFERGEVGRESSWAGAGMLSPYTDDLRDDWLQDLCRRSLQIYPNYVTAIRDTSGLDPHLQLDGIVSIAYDGEQRATLRTHAGALNAIDHPARLLDRDETLQIEPAFGKHLIAGLLVEREGTVDNRRLARALLVACQRSGVILYERCGEITVECDARRVLGVRTHDGFVSAGAVVNAAGAWAAQVRGVPQTCVPPVYPVKGQILALQVPTGFVRHVVWLPGAYLVPRDDGRLIVGATEEHDAGFDVRVTARGVGALLNAAVTAAPALADFTLTETWAGLRPGTPDKRPRIGPAPLNGYFWATGHYRNGILLAPITATMIADGIEAKIQEYTSA